MLQTDVKGWIPHFMVNAFAARAPLDWREGLANYYANVYSKKDEGEGGAPAQQGQSTAEKGSGEGASVDAEGGQGPSEEGGGDTQGQSTGAEGGESQGQSEAGAGGEGQSASAETTGEVAPEGETKKEEDTEAPADQ